MKPLVTLYTRNGCCLCDTARSVVGEARRRADFEYREFDIDTDPELQQRYNEQVPVVAINGVDVFRYAVDLQEFLRRLAACGGPGGSPASPRYD
jgi:glutaredoxin